jgi:rhamnose utilization protein RhaD (predicted bifunctional aldolase and dehydrogenase)
MLVQGGGGNTSLKENGTIWVKASGTWLAESAKRDIFARVDLEQTRSAVARGVEPRFAPDPAAGSTMRPSIETSLHVVLPHRIVAHYHSVRAIAWSVLQDAHRRLAPLLEGLRWNWVPYRRPGLPLASAVLQVMKSRPDVLVLANHGVVVGGETCDEVWSLIREVERRLECPARASPEPDLAALEMASAGTDYLPAARPELHGIGTDGVSLRIARGGSLYPDHVVFLGPRVEVLDGGKNDGHASLDAAGPPLVAVAGKGVLMRRSVSPGQSEMAACLALVLPRIPADARVRYLTAQDEAELLGWEAEAYRKDMSR